MSLAINTKTYNNITKFTKLNILNVSSGGQCGQALRRKAISKIDSTFVETVTESRPSKYEGRVEAAETACFI